MTNSVRYRVLSVCTMSWILVTLPWFSSSAFCGTLCTRRSISKGALLNHRILLLFRHHKGLKGVNEEDRLSPFFSVLSTCDGLLLVGSRWRWRSFLHDTRILSIWAELQHDSTIQEQLSSRVTLDGANMQEVVVRVYAILKSGFVASSVDVTQPLRIWESSSTFTFAISS